MFKCLETKNLLGRGNIERNSPLNGRNNGINNFIILTRSMPNTRYLVLGFRLETAKYEIFRLLYQSSKCQVRDNSNRYSFLMSQLRDISGRI